MKLSIIFFSLFLANVAVAEPLSAIVTFASTVITAEGITKQTQFQDLLVRDKNRVWSQRLLPDRLVSQKDEHHTGEDHQGEHHRNLNFSLAARWMELENDNRTRFRLVRAEDKTVIEPRINEYGTLGFDGVWETAFYQVNRSALQVMTALKKSAPKHALWYEKKDEQMETRILWDEKNAIPLVIETASRDGKVSNSITFKLVTPPAILPWDKLAGYQTIAYEDLLD